MGTVTFTGVNRLLANMRGSANGAHSGAVKATRKVMAQVLEESQPLVPVETGSLKASGRIVEDLVGDKISVSVTYGSAEGVRDSSKYAVYVHEDLTKKHLEPTGAKFLEIPFMMIAVPAVEEYKMYIGEAMMAGVKK